MPEATLSALRRLLARRRPRYALPRWAFRCAHLAASAPHEFAWRYDTVESRSWGAAGVAPD